MLLVHADQVVPADSLIDALRDGHPPPSAAKTLQELRLAALEWRAEAELALGGHVELVGELEQLVGQEPFREQLWGYLMLALYWRGLAGRVATADGVLAAADGRPEDAGEAFAAAVETFQAYGCRWDEAEAGRLCGKALPAKADQQRHMAVGLYHRIGAGRRWAAWAAEPSG